MIIDSGAATHAKLIDCESVCKFGTDLEKVPVRPRFASLEKKAGIKRCDAAANRSSVAR